MNPIETLNSHHCIAAPKYPILVETPTTVLPHKANILLSHPLYTTMYPVQTVENINPQSTHFKLFPRTAHVTQTTKTADFSVEHSSPASTLLPQSRPSIPYRNTISTNILDLIHQPDNPGSRLYHHYTSAHRHNAVHSDI